jgi:hypothetical protein
MALFVPAALVACWHGQPLKSRHWPGCQHEARIANAGATYLVRHAFTVEGSEMNRKDTAPKDETPTSDQASGVSGEQLSFLPTPVFCPILPPSGNAAKTALNGLLARNLTQIDWLNKSKGWRLSAAVKSLDYLGWEPKLIMGQNPEWPKEIARNSLPAKAKQAATLMRQGVNHA